MKCVYRPVQTLKVNFKIISIIDVDYACFKATAGT